MKDAKGHGSESRFHGSIEHQVARGQYDPTKGAHSAGVEAATNSQFTPAQLDQLRAGFGGINTVDPEGESYKKITGMLDKMSQDQLKYLSGSGIKFVSKLAANRVGRPQSAINKIKQPADVSGRPWRGSV